MLKHKLFDKLKIYKKATCHQVAFDFAYSYINLLYAVYCLVNLEQVKCVNGTIIVHIKYLH